MSKPPAPVGPRALRISRRALEPVDGFVALLATLAFGAEVALGIFRAKTPRRSDVVTMGGEHVLAATAVAGILPWSRLSPHQRPPRSGAPLGGLRLLMSSRVLPTGQGRR
jgi:hypothetical protein